jgi:hypothetical protein
MDNEDFPIGLQAADLGATRRFYVEPIYSRLRAENVAACSIRAPTHQVAGVTNLTVLCAEFLPASVMRPLLPPGFLFAVLDPTGQVLFHSDDSRNLRENFVTECGDDPRLRAAQAGRIVDDFELEYYQRPHRVRIEPLKGFPWTLVVLRDQGPLNSVRASQTTTTLAVLMASGGLWLILGLLVGLWRIQVQRRQDLLRWLWPATDSVKAYKTWSFMNSVVLCVFVVLELSQFPLTRHHVVFWFAIGLGPACVAGSCFLLSRVTARRSGSCQTLSKPANQIAFVSWLTTSLAVFVIPGVLATHRLTAEIETDRFVRWTQAKLGQEIVERWRTQPTGLTNDSPGDYSRAFLETTWSVTSDTSGELPPPSFFQHAVHVLRHDFKDPDKLGVEMHGWGYDAAADGSWWSQPESRPFKLFLRVPQPESTNTALAIASWPLTFPTLSGLDPWVVLSFTGILLGLLAAFLAAWFVASRIFLLRHRFNSPVTPRNFLVAVGVNLSTWAVRATPATEALSEGERQAVHSFIRYEFAHLQLHRAEALSAAAIEEQGVLVCDWHEQPASPTEDELSKLVRIARIKGVYVLVLVATDEKAEQLKARGAELAGTWTLDPGDGAKESVLGALAAHHMELWKASASAERMALWEVGRNGFVDAHHPAVPSLLQRGLLRLDPKLRLPSASFRRFVLSFSAEQLDAVQADDARNSWPMIRSLLVVVALAVMAFLMLTQPDTWQRTTGVVAGLLAGFKLMGDLIGAFREKTAAGPTQG